MPQGAHEAEPGAHEAEQGAREAEQGTHEAEQGEESQDEDLGPRQRKEVEALVEEWTQENCAQGPAAVMDRAVAVLKRSPGAELLFTDDEDNSLSFLPRIWRGSCKFESIGSNKRPNGLGVGMSSCRDITISAIQSSQPLNQWVERSHGMFVDSFNSFYCSHTALTPPPSKCRKSPRCLPTLHVILLKPVQQPRKQQSDATKATRALLVEQHHKQSLALDADLKEHHAKQEELIEMLVLKYGRTEEYMRKLVCNGAKYGNKHRVNMRNTILHKYCNKAREEGSPSNVCDVQDEISGEEYQRIKDSLSREDLAHLRAQLEEHRDRKQHGVRGNKQVLPTGHRADHKPRWRGDDAPKPHIVDSDNASRFFTDVLKMSPLDAIHKMEQWACTCDKDVDANTADANRQKLVTEWSNYRLKMMHELRVEMAGWPSNIESKPPSKLCADDACRICDLMKTGTIHWVALTASQHTELTQEIEAKHAAGTVKKCKQHSDKDLPCRPRTKKSAATKGTEGEASALTATVQSPGDGVQPAAMQIPVQAPSNGIQAAMVLSPALELTGVGAPASSLVVGPMSIAATTSSPVAAITTPASSPVAAVTTPASEVSVTSSAPALGSVAAPTSSPVAAVTAPASVASSVPAFGSSVDSTSTFLGSPILHMRGSCGGRRATAQHLEHDDDNWGFDSLSVNSAIAHGVNGSAPLVHTGGTLLSFNVDNKVFPAALVLPNANTTAAASTSSTSVFSVATNTVGNTGKKRKRSGDDGGEKATAQDVQRQGQAVRAEEEHDQCSNRQHRRVKAAAKAAPALLNAPPCLFMP
ncbi:hypothetical protein B0H14DRAFT_2566159 [Mycena olivaceomarginata]|nr:hypothetical protein B0H14DRAFT_2566159 [Mycena olivaceomarginata]